MNQLMNKLKFFLKWLIVFFIFVFIIKTIAEGYNDIRDYSFTFNLYFLILAFIFFVLSYTVTTYAWLYLLEKQGYKNIPFIAAFRIWFYSFMARYIPGKVAIIAARAQLCKKYNIPVLVVSNVAILEVFLILSTAIFFILPIQVLRGTTIIGSALIFLVLGTLAIFLLQNKKFVGTMARYLPPFRKITPLSISLGVIVKVVLIYAFYWIMSGVAVVAFLSSFTTVEPGDVLTIISSYALAYVGGILAVFAPSGLGVREVAFAALLQAIYPKELAFVIAVAVRLWATVSEVILWAILFIPSKLTHSRAGTEEKRGYFNNG